MNVDGKSEKIIALGLMSGTSLDGIDAALIETDGDQVTDIGVSLTLPYPDKFRSNLMLEVENAGKRDRPTNDQALARDLTDLHTEAVKQLLKRAPQQSKWERPAVIGFHGHTILHRPDLGFTQQLGDAERLANSLHIPVVSDFRSSDVSAGGQGAPLAPVFHAAMFQNEPRPVSVVNIGGISNLTWIGQRDDDLTAFDTGPGNGLLDKWIEAKTGARFDENGRISAQGTADNTRLTSLLDHSYFNQPWPKSLDRSDFNLSLIEGLSVEDGAATLVDFTVKSIDIGIRQCSEVPAVLFVTGGGRHNPTMMSRLSEIGPCPVKPVEEKEWDGDAVEAQAFAYMAVRSMRGLPLTFTGTTGVKCPMTGGVMTHPN